jgi:predicted amidohydrolase YtcJ
MRAVSDFVELDRDPITVEPAEIAELKVRSTWVGGRRVFAAA